MNWTVDIRTVRQQTPDGVQPTRYEAAISLPKPTGGTQVTVADLKQLLADLTANNDIPDTARLGEAIDLRLSWEAAPPG